MYGRGGRIKNINVNRFKRGDSNYIYPMMDMCKVVSDWDQLKHVTIF